MPQPTSSTLKRFAPLILLLVMVGGFRLFWQRGAETRISGHRTVSCVGSASARHFAVYLHGVDTEEPAEEELRNRDTLARIAARLDLRLAIPRATGLCAGSTDRRCWPSKDAAAARVSLEQMQEAAGVCFPAGVPYGAIGFGQGGSALAAVFRHCLPGHPAWMLSVAAPGPEAEPAASMASPKAVPQSLRECGNFRMLVGKGDGENYGRALAFSRELLGMGADVRWVEFDGGHWIPFDSALAVVQDVVETGPGAQPPTSPATNQERR